MRPIRPESFASNPSGRSRSCCRLPSPRTRPPNEATERAYASYTGGTPEQRRLRDLLQRHMEAEGFSAYEFEWWHFDYRDWKAYAIQNVRFEDIGRTR